jgi:hypothetical protein
MTSAFETAVTLIEQLSSRDQARLMLFLAERLHHRLGAEAAPGVLAYSSR